MALSKGHTFTSGEVVTPTKLNNLVDNATIGDGTITTAMIADDAITSDKIADGSVTSSHLASGAGGGVTSVTAGNGLDGGEITSSGTIAIPTSGGTLNINNGKIGIGGDADSAYAAKITGDLLISDIGGTGNNAHLTLENTHSTDGQAIIKASAPGDAILQLKDTATTGTDDAIYNVASASGKFVVSSVNDAEDAITTLMQLSPTGGVQFDQLPTSDPSVTGELWNDGGVVRVSGSSGVTLSTLPTTDPSVAGQLWNDGGVVSVSGSSGYSGAGDTFTLGTKQTLSTNSGSSYIEFTGIPSGVKQINIMVDRFFTGGNAVPTMQIGDSGGYETSGYYYQPITGTSAQSEWIIGYGYNTLTNVTPQPLIGIVTMNRIDDYTWVYSSNLTTNLYNQDTAYPYSGSKTLSGTLDRIRIPVNSTSGSCEGINISYI